MTQTLRQHAEQQFAEELAELAKVDENDQERMPGTDSLEVARCKVDHF